MGMAGLLLSRGDKANSIRLATEAQILKERFNEDFWMPSKGFYAQALDGSKRPVPSISSNPGHALYCGIADEDKAARVVERLMAPDMLSGWGIRCLSTHEPHFNPMSYHNGSIWPHDNGIIAAGMRRYGFHEEAAEVMKQVVEAGTRFHLFRMPELYCGFARDLRYYSVPAEYPVSCSPQAWAAGCIVHFCQIMLGIEPSQQGSTLTVSPCLLPGISRFTADRLGIWQNPLDMEVVRRLGQDRVDVVAKDNPGGIKVVAP
jgi:glycogen debranching enzyme